MRDDKEAWLDRAVGILLLLAAAVRILYVLLAPLDDVASRSSDDAYYYFQVARNIVSGHGPTFDGIHPTNGFHPLWMVCLLPLFAIFGSSPESGLRAVFVLVALLAAGTGWLAYRVFADLAGRRTAVLGLLLLVQPFAVYPLVNGLETGLLIALQFALLRFAQTSEALRPEAPERARVLFGGLLGLTVLARLDSIFLLPSLAVALGIAWSRVAHPQANRGWLRALVAIGLPAVLVIAPYLIWNLTTFEHLVPISGAVKSTFPEITFGPERLRGFRTIYGLGQLGLAFGLLLLLALRGSPASRHSTGGWSSDRVLLAAMLGANLMHAAYTFLFVSWGAQWWHFASYLPVTLCLTVFAIRSLTGLPTRGRTVFAGAVAVLVLALAGGWAWEARERGSVRARWHDAAAWAAGHLPPGAVVAMTDCGYFAYMSGRPVVNLDGIINGYAYQEALRDHRLRAFLAEAGVTHIGGHAAHYDAGNRYVIRTPARLYRGRGSAIVTTPEAEVYRSKPFPYFVGSGTTSVRYTLWDFGKVTVLDDARDLDR